METEIEKNQRQNEQDRDTEGDGLLRAALPFGLEWVFRL
jgi:hypothetical protein